MALDGCDALAKVLGPGGQRCNGIGWHFPALLYLLQPVRVHRRGEPVDNDHAQEEPCTK
jgi:hypothetical protein